jgi:hypothetical protein
MVMAVAGAVILVTVTAVALLELMVTLSNN